MRALWTGTLTFGLITIPVKLYSAVEERGGIKLEEVHRTDLAPIRTVRWCSQEDKEVPFTEIVKAFAYAEGKYVTLEEEDFERAQPGGPQSIDVHEFASPAELDPAYCSTPYLLLPAEGGEKAYVLLREALTRTGHIGVATFVFRGRGRLGYIRVRDGLLLLQRLRFTEEVRRPSSLDLPQADITEEEAETAATLVEYLSRPLRMADYRDTYTEALRSMIDRKIRGERMKEREEAAGREPTSPDDLMRQLRASLHGKAGRFRRTPAPSRRRERKRVS